MTDTGKPLLRVLQGEAVWPPPIWLMRQAGRYLPEFRALRDQADFITRCMTPDLATEITLQPIRRYAMDGAILFSDILILPWAMGQSLDFVAGKGPILGAIRSEADLARLDPKRVPDATAPVMETLSRLRAILDGPDPIGAAQGGRVTLLGFAGAPFTVACYMVEGHGSREFDATRGMAYSDPLLFDRLMATLTQATADMLVAQIDAGAEAVMLFDSWSGLLPPAQFRRHVIAPTRAIVQEIQARRPGVPVIGFPRLAGIMAAEYARETGLRVMALDTGADMAAMAGLLPPGMTVQGNLDPLLLLAGGDAMAQEARAIRDAMKGRPHVFNLGHGVVPPTPPEHVGDLVRTVREV
ncbi:uroporphyrinogen decarboxylase [Gluconacetobacter diazotrophicus PA1 5]|uniref:Uroporphyrinogen decarboxylase n=3 Tax=Gluconacetobacter diazotrophicus TaxID=33996 RepID=DCUP_GLUDA|nr:uroporphyrinogen decarboxylase [Gluconacetobacter diazotrophicus]A9HDX7.1 RecName: Full=Uroporphyrinogen decarboxylase; Short=UPD; Short=URO-D [Gluconacetobacter diazotrophicus PA1 5]ACI51687.1 uroporphyrinogen decarboxylase [Gluconacetobacter diazotrophicus PA1 5]MBB2155273.1 uroporphyrinogen decarboxylase [Gluconacetobacter diazotrophicus]TWB11031.1 uroporphyrinogen decarboxylase [Gluconacetobacter diazotrophicus]CAP55158.1 Uroporphyrinogen decarboxylase [Gluconacetobacter diazotrophicus 